MTMDDPFFDIVKDLDIQIDHESVEDISKLETVEIMLRIEDIETELFQSQQALDPSNQRSRDLHSMRNALQVELRKRSK
jgi:hypothetical protein